MGAKLAAGCLLALGVGAGCVALGGHLPGALAPHHAAAASAGRPHAAQRAARAARLGPGEGSASRDGTVLASRLRAVSSATAANVRPGSARQARREFGPEQAMLASADAPRARKRSPFARAASVREGGEQAQLASPSTPTTSAAGSERYASQSAAQREFAPG